MDVAIVLREVPRNGLERARLVDRIWRVMEPGEVLWWYPFEIHLITKEGLQLLKEAIARTASAVISYE